MKTLTVQFVNKDGNIMFETFKSRTGKLLKRHWRYLLNIDATDITIIAG